ncbi:MAG: hypothetical protein HYV90_01560 [Candidatus Woesebacteria bacterium]|nr:MAG: hypothetical protein HYV90_01560 [Candidatus Woesebacteria bacterium]
MVTEREGWQRIEIGTDHFIEVRPIDPKVLAEMPETSRTFLQVGPIELIVHDIKKLLHPNEKIPY